MQVNPNYWRQCNSCKKEIPYGQGYYECSVSTCTRKRTGYVFCSVPCWERHLPGARHRDAGAIEKRSPSRQQWEKELSDDEPTTVSAASTNTGARRIVKSAPSSSTPKKQIPREILIVASKLKHYIRERSGMNTSNEVLGALSDQVRILADEAIDKARAAGRKTVLDRDFKS